ncbi:hypothetical protein JCM6882_006388 [Rhodosporidiobolus microsporus]
MSLIRSAARRLGIGKYRYWQGSDLQGNNFFERPHPEFPGEWRKNKRYVEYRESRPLSDYDFRSIPVQWTSWLRRTRRAPPTIQELEVDLARQIRLQDNVQRLEEAYREEKLRLAESDRAALLQEPVARASAVEGEEAGRAGLSTEQRDGLPAKDGDLGQQGRPAEIAREVGSGHEKVEGDRVVPKQEESPEELAKKRREQERAEAIKRREEFARQQAATPRGNPSDSFQPQGWTPGPARRRA